MPGRHGGRLGCATLGLLVVAQPACPQVSSAVQGNAVLSRDRPGLGPVGIPIGGFRLYPALNGSVGYDDNIYNVRTDIRKSPIVAVQPKLAVRSKWSNHRLNLDAEALIERYPDLRTENNNQYGATLSGRLDATRAMQVEGEARAARAIEQRGTPGDLFTRGEPVRFDRVGGTLSARMLLGPVLLQAGGARDSYSYKDARVGPALLDQSYRNHDSTVFTGRLGYQLGPSVTVFAQGGLRRERYDQAEAARLLDANEMSVLGGVRFEITELMSGELGVGYLRRRYRSGAFGRTSAFAYDGALTWNPTTLLTVTARARKSIEESPFLSASGIVTDAASVEADYELLRNLLVNGRLSRVREDYRDLDRRDRRIEARVGLRYLLNRLVELGASYDRRRQRGSGIAGRDYGGNAIRLSVTVQR
ncbi:outer membrane beta-barrel protein [uncultured Sphingomonas sp.]|uniref:outer membrane beta-barrel protein n=1 Tax=uncultured Sphingomonas sp. TaxID=158754 RepID=UPI0025F8DC6D|nr:outer membrane beta-barrel protein [uncultured Sphingomonas sp.]